MLFVLTDEVIGRGEYRVKAIVEVTGVRDEGKMLVDSYQESWVAQVLALVKKNLVVRLQKRWRHAVNRFQRVVHIE